MTKKPSHIPLFPDAYLRDNYRLTLEQHGLFLMLMMEAWARPDCYLPGSDEALAGIAQIPVAKFRKICGPVLAQWTREGDKIFQKRLLKEWQYVQTTKGKRADAAKVRWNAHAMQMHSKCNASGMHLGGGGGEGVTLPREELLDEVESDQPFRVIGGGK